MQKTCYCYKMGRMPYAAVWGIQRQMVTTRRNGQSKDAIILVEHDSIFTIGRAGSHKNIIVPEAKLNEAKIAVVDVDRGGDITYHGPGQLVGYPIFDLSLHGRDLHRYVRQLEEVIIRTVGFYGIEAWREQGLTGVWTEKGKIAAIGVGVKGWVSMHGFALNIKPDMKYFKMINPCGITDRPVASMEMFSVKVSLENVADVLMQKFAEVFEIEIISSEEQIGCNYHDRNG